MELALLQTLHFNDMKILKNLFCTLLTARHKEQSLQTELFWLHCLQKWTKGPAKESSFLSVPSLPHGILDPAARSFTQRSAPDSVSLLHTGMRPADGTDGTWRGWAKTENPRPIIKFLRTSIALKTDKGLCRTSVPFTLVLVVLKSTELSVNTPHSSTI